MTQQKQLRFSTEESLVTEFVTFLDRTRSDNFEILHEFEGGFGRPDLLLYAPPTDSGFRSIESLSSINPRLAPLLSITTSRAIKSIESLSKAAGTSEHSARRIFAELFSIGRLKLKGETGRHFRIDPIRTPPFPQVVAIEAKLRDWRRALVQAYRYIQFSNESWVLLDHANVSSALKNFQTFKSYGIGLASFSMYGELFIHVSAKNLAWSSGVLAWRTQALLARSYKLTRTDQQP